MQFGRGYLGNTHHKDLLKHYRLKELRAIEPFFLECDYNLTFVSKAPPTGPWVL